VTIGDGAGAIIGDEAGVTIGDELWLL